MNELIQNIYYQNGHLFWNTTISNRALKDCPCGTKKQNGYIELQYRHKRYYEHRVIWYLFYGDIPNEMVIDHIDQNPSNNSITNLRLIPQSINLHNTKKRNTNKSGYKGISWDKSTKSWVASLSYKGNRVYRKRFSNIEEANKQLIRFKNKFFKQLGSVCVQEGGKPQ